MTGKAFGEENPTLGETAVSWQTWSDGAAGIPEVQGDADWGKLQLSYTGEEGRSAVYDLGSAKTRTFTLTENRYGTGSGNATLQYRTDTSAFVQDDVLPAWSNYTFSFSVNCRYIQVRETTELLAPAFFVAPAASGGDDDNAGTEAEPWETIQHAIDTVSAGDTVYIREGTYNEWAQALWGNGGGSAGNYVTYRNYPGESPILDGDGFTLPYSNDGVFNIQNTSYVRVSGLRVINSTKGAIEASYCDHIIIDHCSTYNTQNSGISCWYTDYTLIASNDVELACCAGSEECITINGGDYHEVKNNTVHDSGSTYGWTGGQGINLKTAANHATVHHNLCYNLNQYAFGVDAWNAHSTDIKFYSNIAHDCSVGFIIESEYGGYADDCWVYNNLAYHMKPPGSTYWGEGYGTPPWGEENAGYVKDVYFINNVAHECLQGFYGRTVHASSDNIIIRNNIFSQNTNNPQIVLVGGTSGKYVIDHNLFYGNLAEPLGTDSVTGDPKFVTAGSDFHLQSDSPAISAGDATDAPAFDYDLQVRPTGVGYDIGAYEYVP